MIRRQGNAQGTAMERGSTMGIRSPKWFVPNASTRPATALRALIGMIG
jgi:hypothetical protein